MIPLLFSDILQLDVSQGVSAVVTAIIPTPFETETPTPTQTSTITIIPTFIDVQEADYQPDAWEWLLSNSGDLGKRGRHFCRWESELISIRWGMRWGLLSVIGGMSSYIFLASRIAGSESFLEKADTGAPAFLIIFGIIAGWGIGWVWWQLLEGQKGS